MKFATKKLSLPCEFLALAPEKGPCKKTPSKRLQTFQFHFYNPIFGTKNVKVIFVLFHSGVYRQMIPSNCLISFGATGLKESGNISDSLTKEHWNVCFMKNLLLLLWPEVDKVTTQIIHIIYDMFLYKRVFSLPKRSIDDFSRELIFLTGNFSSESPPPLLRMFWSIYHSES